MISASDGDSAPSAATNAPDPCGVVAAISMPRSSAAVLTLVSTPSPPESCTSSGSEESAEVPLDEGDRGVRDGFGSSPMQRTATRWGEPQICKDSSTPPHVIGYHARPAVPKASREPAPVQFGLGTTLSSRA